MATNELRVVLVGAAKAAHDSMLTEARADGRTTINSSKLVNWIVSDYFEHSFQRRKKTLIKEHFNSRKCVLEAMKSGNPDAIRRALQDAAKSFGRSNRKKAKTVKLESGAPSDEKKIVE